MKSAIKRCARASAKYFCLCLAIVPALMLCAQGAFGQNEPQNIIVPVSRPGQPVSLQIEIPSARIEVMGEDRPDADFAVTSYSSERKLSTPSGTKSLSGGSYEVRVDERDNVISVIAGRHASSLKIIARIPRRADLILSTTKDGEIKVRDITGNLQLTNANGLIAATNIDGSMIAEGMNEPIDVDFSRIGAGGAMALSSLNGDISLSLPATARVELRIDTAKGEIHSDFEMDIKPSTPAVERSQSRGGVAVQVEDPIVATINGGGPVIRIKTLNGNIRIGKSGK